MRYRTKRVLALASAVAVAAAPAWAGTTERVSVGTGGVQANGLSLNPALSADGRFVAFESAASNLVRGDTGAFDVFVHDRRTGRTTGASVGPDRTLSDGASDFPSISADGRLVAFLSSATNLVPGETGRDLNVFVRDLAARRTTRVSPRPVGDPDVADVPLPLVAISADGRVVAFGAIPLVRPDEVFARDLGTGRTRRVSVGPGGVRGDERSSDLAISADGRFVAFESDATNLVRGDTNRVADVFVHDRRARETVRVSVGPGGRQGDGGSSAPAISADGRFVAFASSATNLVPGDTNGETDVFVRDRATGGTERVSVGPGGAQADGFSFGPAISADGRFVAFESSAANLVAGDTNAQGDVFVRDRRTGETVRVSLGRGGAQGDGTSFRPAISADGRVVAFLSEATNLVPGDTNGEIDVFVRAP